MSAAALARLVWRANRLSGVWHVYANGRARRSLCRGAHLNRSRGRRRLQPQGEPCRVCAAMLRCRGLPPPLRSPWGRPVRYDAHARSGHSRHDERVLVAVASSFAPRVRPAVVNQCRRCGAVTDAIAPADLHAAGIRLVAGHTVSSG